MSVFNNVKKGIPGEPLIKQLVQGRSGAGKTVLCASASTVPEMSPILILDFQAGLMSLGAPGVKKIVDLRNIDVLSIHSFREFKDVYEELRKGEHRYKTIVIDTLSDVARMVQQQVMDVAVRKDPSRDPLQLGIGEWGKSLEQMRRVLEGFRYLSTHMLVSVLTSEDRDDVSGVIKARPSVAGRLRDELPWLFDIVGFLVSDTKKEGDNVVAERSMYFMPTRRWDAKDRTGVLPFEMEDPSMGKIYQMIKEKRTNGQKES